MKFSNDVQFVKLWLLSMDIIYKSHDLFRSATTVLAALRGGVFLCFFDLCSFKLADVGFQVLYFGF